MRVTALSEVQARPRRVAVGEFDGVHVGHRAVIAGNDTVLTFEPHPATVVKPERAPKLLTSLAVKSDLIAGLGVQELVVAPFDERLAHQAPSEFVDSILVEALGASSVSVGQNFRFGYDASGDSAMLTSDDRFATRVVPLVSVDGATVSSSRIRALVADGDVGAAARLLGAPFQMRAEVVRGDQRGRELGFPTANMIPDPLLVCPAYGVYACRVGEYLAATNVGVRPTFGSDLMLLVESFLLDFKADLYGQELTVEFVERLRPEQRFDQADELIAQMRRDVERTRELLGSGVV
jgi:riboflavin kinase/FMN adenylyltransferase